VPCLSNMCETCASVHSVCCCSVLQRGIVCCSAVQRVTYKSVVTDMCETCSSSRGGAQNAVEEALADAAGENENSQKWAPQ